MLDLTRLTSFIALIDAGSFTAAAKALSLSKAAVSQHVRKLEADLGSALVIRNTRRLAATEAGARLYAAGSVLLVEAERIEMRAKQHAGVSGTLRLASTNEYLSHVLAPHLASFVRAHPRLALEVFGAAGLADMVAGRFDAAVRFGNPANSALRATRLTSFRLFPVASPALLARCGEPHDLDALARLPWVLHRHHQNPALWTRGAESRTMALSSRLITDVIDTNRSLALDGLGVILGAEWRIQEDVVAGRLVRLLPEWSPPAIPVYVVRPPAPHMPVKVRALIQHLRDALGS